ncbi:MAG: hypothetical protein ACTHKZ_04015, partial [Lysobacteraceae bacterium]
MVHAARFPTPAPGFVEVPRLDFNRILGCATAIAVHGVLLLLLLVPVTAPPTPTEAIRTPIRWILDQDRTPPPPPPPTVPVTHHRTSAPTSHPVQPQVPPVHEATVVDEAVV